MGCAPSKGTMRAVSSVPSSARVEQVKRPTDPPSSTDTGESKGPKVPGNNKVSTNAVQHGYSSGASSCSDDEDDTMEVYADGNRNRAQTDILGRSFHSHILDLSALREQMVADGDISKTVVRMETPFGKPIEEIYDGVHDGKVLGSGVSGVVRLVTHRATGVKYAVKCLDIWLIKSVEGLRQLREEIAIMCQLDHPNIVRIEEVYESADEIYIVQELCLGGDLFDRLDEQPDFHYTEVQCARLVKQMLSSIRYLHSKKITHRDLKLENFLFTTSKPESQLKMIDFGLSKHFEFGQQLADKVGTPYTVAPEILRGPYDEKCDIWSIGVITYLLLSGETPFGGLDGESLASVRERIIKAQVRFEPKEIWGNVSNDGKHFVKMMLQADPKMRPSAKQAQRDPWIRVWAAKDAKEGNKLNSQTISALMSFKESSDMQKMLCEVLSFTLLPEQIEELREDFEKIDPDGDGEISLKALKRVLIQNAEAGALGSLTEIEVEEIFDSIRVRKTDPKIRWHEFLAAGLSLARVDDRNLRLAFDRLDTQRKGFITFDDLHDVIGAAAGSDALEKMWFESITQCRAQLDRITFSEFKLLMKGQPQEPMLTTRQSSRSGPSLPSVPEGEKPNLDALGPLSGIEELSPSEYENARAIFQKKRSQSYEQKTNMWDEESSSFSSGQDNSKSRMSMIALPTGSLVPETSKDYSVSPLVANRALYRKHREMRLAVLEASRKFDKKRSDIQSTDLLAAGLIMKRGAQAPFDLEESHNRTLFDEASKRCGRSRRTKNKTVSDVTGMLSKATVLN